MMQRFTIHAIAWDIDPKGEWVRYEDVRKLVDILLVRIEELEKKVGK